MNINGMKNRVIGSFIGLACGDAVGTSLEFKPRGSFDPIEDMIGGGPFNLLPGEWTDDTSMALCLAESLLYKKGFDATDQMNRYCNWYHHGYMSCTNECFDIGCTVSTALNRYLQTNNPFSGSVDINSSGNGSLMRLAPIAMVYRSSPIKLLSFAEDSSRTTHASSECVDSCRYLASLLVAAYSSVNKDEIFNISFKPSTPKVASIASGAWKNKNYNELKGSGYVIQSLEAAIWCFYHSTDFKDAILLSANLGDDADTTAAICGQLAGAYYGLESIPAEWRARLAWSEKLHQIAECLYDLGASIEN